MEAGEVVTFPAIEEAALPEIHIEKAQEAAEGEGLGELLEPAAGADFGALQATAAGVSIAFGGIARDFVSGLALQGSLGPALAVPVTGYSFVYYTEICLLFITLAAVGPLVRRASLPSANQPAKIERFGMADLPG